MHMEEPLSLGCKHTYKYIVAQGMPAPGLNSCIPLCSISHIFMMLFIWISRCIKMIKRIWALAAEWEVGFGQRDTWWLLR